nr:hypothetical protein [Tanacetum cinerariifolium]
MYMTLEERRKRKKISGIDGLKSASNMVKTVDGTTIFVSDHADVIKESGKQESGSTSHVHVADAHNKEADQVGGDRVGNDPAN